MGINEPFRCIVAGHRLLIAVFVIVPLAVIFALGARSPHEYVASSRIQATGDTLGSDTEADSVLNRVRGIATSSDIVRSAMRNAGIVDRNPATVAAHGITVNRLGSSAVVDIDVTDRSPQTARALAGALAGEVVRFMQGSSSASSDELLRSLKDQEQSDLSEKDRILKQLANATTPAQTAQLSAELSGVDQQLSDLSGTIQQLQLAIATNSSAAVIATDNSASRATSNIALRLILGGIGGLVAGLLVASLIEVIRPRVADARAVAREFDAPVLGPIGVTRTARRRWSPARLLPTRLRRRKVGLSSLDPAAVLALRRASANARVGTVALMGLPAEEAEPVARGLTRALDTAVASTNGRARAEAGPRPVTGGGARQATRTATAIKEVIAPAPNAAVRVTTVERIGAGTPGERYGLVVVGRRLMPSSEVRRITDLAAATGWPVVGVLDIDAPSGRENS